MNVVYSLYVRFMVWLGAAPPPEYEHLLELGAQATKQTYQETQSKKAKRSPNLFIIAAGALSFVLIVAGLGLGLYVGYRFLSSAGRGDTAKVEPVKTIETPAETTIPAGVPLEPASPSVSPSEILTAFNKGDCATCHTIPGLPDAKGQVGPDLSGIGVSAATRLSGYSATEYIRESILEPNAFIVPECPLGDCPAGVMPQSFAGSLSEADLDAIVSYLSTLGTGQEIVLDTTSDPESPLEATLPAQSAPEPVVLQPLEATLPAESVLEPFIPLPKEPPGEAQIALGKYLFFDPRLSNNSSLSCASCHQPDKAFTDGQALGQGYPSTKYFRNAPTLYNTVYSNYLYWDGRMDGADMPTLIRDHITEAHFMSNDGRLMVERLKQIPPYVALFNKAFGNEPGFGGVLKAITAYVQSLNSPAIPYDRYLAGDSTALSEEAQAGLALFAGKAQCSRCHAAALLSDGRFYNTGVATDPAMLEDPERHLTFRRFFRVLGVPNYRNLGQDVGLYALTIDQADWGKFRTPGLREVGRTAPYMHNGSLATLEDVVRFYNQGGGSNQTADLQPLGLTGAEINQLVAFLESLSSNPVPVETPILPDYQLLTLADPAPVPANQQFPPPAAQGESPPLAPLPPVSAPPDNPITPKKVDLGRLLYFDPRMSADGIISCDSCHPASTGWGAPAGISFSRPGTSHWRHAQTILNVAYYTKLNWDGNKKSIESQNSGAWSGAIAGNIDKALAEERLAQIPEYLNRFRNVFGTEYPHWDDALKAVATYQRTIVSREAPFDAYLAGNEAAISDAARRGFELFRGEANCIACHNGPLVSDDRYHATGVPMSTAFLNSPLKQITFRYEQWAKGVPEEMYRSASQDHGLFYVTKRDEDRGKFRTASLRDLCYTAPYMHNGSIGTLEEVVAFYNAGGGDVPNKSRLLQPLNLSASEQNDLATFLRSLCGDPVTDRAPELPPYGAFPVPEQ